MGSAEILDLAKLLAPIPGDNPAGADPRTDFSPTSLYREIRDARAKAREAERRDIYEDEGQPEAAAADWKPIMKLGVKLLAEQVKDLEVVALLTEAMVREHGFAGLRDCFRLTRGLVEAFWDGLYPAPDDEGVITRVAPLTGLNGEEGDGLLVGPIGKIPITGGQSMGPFSSSQYQQALELDRIQDPDKLARRLEQPGVVSMQMFDAAVSETSPEFFRELLDDISECSSEFEGLSTALEERCGKDESGYPLAPPSSNIRNVLQDCLDNVKRISAHLFGEEDEESEEDGEGEAAAYGGKGGAALSQVRNREDAFRALLKVAEFFKRTEPHSPVSYALEQAVRWGRMPLPDLLGELIPDETSRQQLYKLVGIQRQEE